MVKVILRWPGRPGSLADVRRQYALPQDALDEAYGIQESDPTLGQFAVRVRAELAPGLENLVSSPGTCRTGAEAAPRDGVRSSLPT